MFGTLSPQKFHWPVLKSMTKLFQLSNYRCQIPDADVMMSWLDFAFQSNLKIGK